MLTRTAWSIAIQEILYLTGETLYEVVLKQVTPSFSKIRIPLMWKDRDHFKNKGDYRRFSVFCLLKIGTEIYDTALVSDVDRSMTDISYDDVLVFNNIPADFECQLQVYSHIVHDDLSIASTPKKITKKITNSVSRAIGRKLAASLKEELCSVAIGPKFVLEAQATLRLSDMDDAAHTHDLFLECVDQLPLFGHFCCKLAVLPDCAVNDIRSGHLSVVQCSGALQRLWCVLRAFQLAFWTNAKDAQHLPPILSIPVNKETRLWTDGCKFPYGMRIGDKVQEHLLVVDSETEYHAWTAYIRQHSRDHEIWGYAAEKDMAIPSPSRLPSFMTRQNSLYDETSLNNSPQGVPSCILQESNHKASVGTSQSGSASSSCSTNFPLAPVKTNFGRF